MWIVFAAIYHLKLWLLINSEIHIIKIIQKNNRRTYWNIGDNVAAESFKTLKHFHVGQLQNGAKFGCNQFDSISRAFTSLDVFQKLSQSASYFVDYPFFYFELMGSA